MRREEYMHESLSRGSTESLARPHLLLNPTERTLGRKVDKGNAQHRTSSNGPKGGGRGRGATKSRSASPGKGKGKEQSSNVCYVYQKGTCTRGKECGFAHTKERPISSSPHPQAGKGRSVCTVSLLETASSERTAETSTVALFQEEERETGTWEWKREGQTSRRHGGRGPRDFYCGKFVVPPKRYLVVWP
jgi:hypothetical protein